MHVSLYVSNLEETVEFYSAFFGELPDKLKDGYAKYILDEPSLIISFIQNPERVQSNFGHLGFQVATQNEMQEKLELAKKIGLKTKEEIGTSCCFAIQDKFWVVDPDGVQWEVYYFHEDAEFNDPRYANENASACCMPPEKEDKPKFQFRPVPKGESNCTPGSGCC